MASESESEHVAICKRCRREYTYAIPKERNTKAPRPELLNRDIACLEYCANCNRVVMSAIYRNNTIYFDPKLPFAGTSQCTQPPNCQEEFD